MIRLSPGEARRATGAADDLDARLAIREAGDALSDCAWSAEAAAWDAPTLHIDDLSGIPFLDGVVGVEFYQLRARVRAGDGDWFCATCPDMADYEAYNREQLGLGSAKFLYAAPAGAPIRVAAACRRGEAFDRLVGVARDAGALRIHPYMGVEAVWELATAVREAAGVPVAVLGPPPAVTWLANDKLRLSELAEALLSDGGAPPVVPTRVGRTAQELAMHLVALARGQRRVALKMTRCASAMGNQIFDAAALLADHEADPRSVTRAVERFLRDKQWDGHSPVLAVAWLDAETSPSTQLWIPPEGPPRVDGVYEQLLVGPEQVFLGSIPSRLGAELDERLAHMSLMVAHAYQALGYVGRCSFDFIVAGGVPYFVECNGRWGGTSTPMALVDRLFPSGRPPYRARDFVCERFVGGRFGDLLEALGDEAWDARTGEGRFVLYNVGCLPSYGKFDVIALGDSLEAAGRALEDDLPALLGS